MTPIPWPTPTPLPPGATPFIDTSLFSESSGMHIEMMENAVQVYNSMAAGGVIDTIMTLVIVMVVLVGFYLIYQLVTSIQDED